MEINLGSSVFKQPFLFYIQSDFQAPVEVVRQGPVETAAVIKQRSKFAEQFAAIAEEHARSDFSREKFGLKKSLEKFGKNLD